MPARNSSAPSWRRATAGLGCHLFTIICALCACAPSALTAATLYTFGGDSFGVPRHFTAVDSSTGTASPQFLLGDGSSSLSGGLAYRSSDTSFFAIANDFLGNSSLVRFNASGSSSLMTLASLGTGFLGGLAFNSADQRFYAIANDNFGNSSLYSFGEDGVLSSPRPLGVGFYGSLTYNSQNGLLYAIATGAGGIQRGVYSLDPAGIGLTTLLFSLGDGSLDFGAGLAWDAANSRFYSIAFDGWSTFSLVTFSLAGANTLASVATLPPVGYRGLVLVTDDLGGGSSGGGGNGGGSNAVPEPSTWALLAGSLAALAALRRNRASGAPPCGSAVLSLPVALHGSGFPGDPENANTCTYAITGGLTNLPQ